MAVLGADRARSLQELRQRLALREQQEMREWQQAWSAQTQSLVTEASQQPGQTSLVVGERSEFEREDPVGDKPDSDNVDEKMKDLELK